MVSWFQKLRRVLAQPFQTYLILFVLESKPNDKETILLWIIQVKRITAYLRNLTVKRTELAAAWSGLLSYVLMTTTTTMHSITDRRYCAVSDIYCI